jgi:hypothetical protein
MAMSKHSEIIQDIRDNGSENYFALRILNDHELINAYKNPKNTNDENAAIREELLDRMA